MEGNGDDQKQVSGYCRGEPKEAVFQRSGVAGRQAVSAKCTGESRFARSHIGRIQGIVFTSSCTGHAIGAGIVVDVHPERIHKAGQINHRTHGTIGSAMHHTTFPPADQ